MEYKIYYLEDKGVNSLMVAGDRILISSKKYSEPEKFVEAFESKSLLETKKEIPLNGVTKISFSDNTSSMYIGYTNEKGKDTAVLYELENAANVVELAQYISQRKDFKKSLLWLL